MKKFLVLTITALMVCMAINANDNSQIYADRGGPEFPGGDVGLMRYIAEHLRYPSMAKEQGIQGKVLLQFVVKKDGSVGEVKVVRSLSPDCDNEAMRVVRSLPKFKPWKNFEGEFVDIWYTLPVVFKLPDDNVASQSVVEQKVFSEE